MDSKEIRKIERAIDSLEHHTDMHHENCDTCRKEVVPQAREVLALLTAEPEPCEDARKPATELLSKLWGIFQKEAEWRDMILWTPMDPRKKVKALTQNDIANFFDIYRVISPAIDALSAYATQVADKRAEELRAQVERLARYEKALRFLHSSGPTPEGFSDDPNDCYEYACGLLTSDDDSLEDDDDPRWFEGWLLMIEAAMKREALAATEPKPSRDDFKRFEKRSGITTDVDD